MIRQRVEELVASEPEWSHFFEVCCETGPARLRAQAWQFRDELESRNLKRGSGSARRLALTLSKVEDALLELAVELAPETPAGSCDPRELLFREAVAWLMEHRPERRLEFVEEIDKKWRAPLGEFREELRSRMRAAAREVAA